MTAQTGDDGQAVSKPSSRRWVMVLFGMPFAAVGIGLLGFMVVPTLLEWQAMQSWQAVPAEILQAELDSSSSDGSTTWRATARYRYEFAGETFENDRVGIIGGSDNIGDFQQQLGTMLEQAQRDGSAVTVYVDPENPAQSVISRELRIVFVLFLTLFALVFGVVGIAIMLAGMFAGRSTSDAANPAAAGSGERPWLARKEWASPLIVSNVKSGAAAAWFFAFVWCAISLPGTLFIPEEIEKGNWAILLILLFDFVGIGLIVWAVRLTWSARKFGSLPLQLDPHPGAIGGDVAGYIDIPVAHDPARLFHVTLSCVRVHVTGSGKNRSTSYDAKWSDEKYLEAEALDSSHVRLWFRFEPPTGLPASDTPDDDYHVWRLDLEAELPGLDLSRQFELPVFATGARSAQRIATRVVASQIPDLTAIEELTNLQQIPGGVAMNFRAGRQWLTGLVLLLVFGGGFGGAGIAVMLSGDVFPSFLFGGIFTLAGALCAAAGIWFIGNRLYVEATDMQVLLRRWLFGVPVRTLTIARSDVAGIGIMQGSTQTNGNRTVVNYDLALKTQAGEIHAIGDGFRGISRARTAAETFARYARLPFIGEVSRGDAFAARKAAYLARRK